MNFYYLIFWIYLGLSALAVADCLKSKNQNKPGWIAAIVMLPFLGPVFYLGFSTGRYAGEL